MMTTDRPVADRPDDVLGRWGLARTIFDLITTSKDDASLKIGIYGGWGEGKTSILRMVENQARRSSMPVCSFPVWSAETQRDLWSGLVEALSSVDDRTDWTSSIKIKSAKFLSGTKTAAEVHPSTKAAHALASLAAGPVRISSKDARRVIERVGTNGRVVVIVDDVDRVDAGLVPKLLMGIHELFEELEHCAVIIALDPDVVSGALGQTNPAWMNGPHFLEKIVQYPFWLPQPDAESLRRLITNTLRDSDLTVLEPAILDLMDLMPRNPRRLKQFVRSLGRVRGTIARFGGEEWNPPLLVLLDLLRVHSPEVAEQLLNDRDFLHDLATANLFVSQEEMHDSWPVTRAQAARIAAAVKQAFSRASQDHRSTVGNSVAQTVAAASERLSAVTPDEAGWHAMLDRKPPVMTLREFDAVYEQWRVDTSVHTLRRLLNAHGSVVDHAEPTVVDACFEAAIRRRGVLIDQAFAALSTDESAQAVARADEILGLLHQLVSDLDALAESSPRRIDRFLSVRSQTTQFANWVGDGGFAACRSRQREFLYLCADRVKDRASDVLKELKPWEAHSPPANVVGLAEIVEARARLLSVFARVVAEEVLTRFRRRGAIAAIANFMSHPAESWILLNREGPFHDSAFRTRLTGVCSEADLVVSENCLTYLRMLVGADDGFSPSTLAQDAELVGPLWTAVARMSPQPRMRQMLTDLATRLRAGLPEPELIHVPAWVEQVAEVDGVGTPNPVVPPPAVSD